MVALAARRSWFCHHQVVAVLWRFERRRTGLAEWLRWAGRFHGRARGCWGTWPVAQLLASWRAG